MTSERSPMERTDELASAWIDGALTDAERSDAAADPEVRAARAEMAAVRDRLSRPVTVPAAVRELHLDRALAEFDAQAGREADAAGATPAPAAVLPFRRRVGATLLGRAAVILLVIGGLGVGLANLGSGDGDDADVAAVTSDEPREESSRMATLDEAGDTDAGAFQVESMDDDGLPVDDFAVLQEAAQEFAADGLLAAPGAARELELRFGPVEGWPARPDDGSSCPSDGSTVPVELDAGPAELVIPGSPPQIADAYYRTLEDCRRLD
jgi:hypothetical protein